ncbi:uncharacterized protein LOC144436552 [Glandiceps talaboti]
MNYQQKSSTQNGFLGTTVQGDVLIVVIAFAAFGLSGVLLILWLNERQIIHKRGRKTTTKADAENKCNGDINEANHNLLPTPHQSAQPTIVTYYEDSNGHSVDITKC